MFCIQRCSAHPWVLFLTSKGKHFIFEFGCIFKKVIRRAVRDLIVVDSRGINIEEYSLLVTVFIGY